jgi:hypothetical protein
MTARGQPSIERIFVSAAHNYFGHAGREPSAHPAVELAEAVCVAGAGIEGDRFFRDAGNHKGQVTFFAMEVFEALVLPWARRSGRRPRCGATSSRGAWISMR